MSTELADAYISLRTKMPGVKNDIATALGGVDADGAGRKIGRKTSDGVGSGFALGGAVAGITASLTNMIAGSIGGLVSEAVVASDATDKFKQTLNFAQVDTTTIDSLTASTKAYADETVYDLATIQNTVAQLAANGVKDYDKLAEAGGNLNAVAGGNAETFKSVGSVLTQTAGAGKLTTENWNQLANAIPGAAGVLQDALLNAGAYTGNFREAMEKGEISADEFNAAIMQVGSDPIAVEAAKSTATFEGAIGSLQATIVGGLTGALNSMKPALTGAISGLSDGLGSAFAFIGELMSAIDFAAFGELLGYISPIGLAFKVLEPLLPLIADAFMQIAGVLGGVLAQILPVLAEAFELVASVLSGALATILPVLIPVVVQLVEILADLAAQILPMLMPVLTMLAEVFTQLLAAVMPIVVALLDALMPILMTLVPVVIMLLDAFLPLIATLVTALAPVLITIADIVLAVLVPVLNTIAEVVTWLAGIVTWFVQEILVPYLNDTLIPAVQLAADIFTTAFGGLGDFFAGIWTGISDGFTGMINWIIDGINGFLGGLNEVGNFISDVTGGAVDFSVGSIPRLADGATVLPRSGGTLAVLAERGRAESVVDTGLMNRALREGLGGSGGGAQIIVQPAPGQSEEVIGQVAANQLNFGMRRSG